MGVFHEGAVEVREPRRLETIGNHTRVINFERRWEYAFPRAETEIDAVAVEAVNEFDRILAGIGEIFDPAKPISISLAITIPLPIVIPLPVTID